MLFLAPAVAVLRTTSRTATDGWKAERWRRQGCDRIGAVGLEAMRSCSRWYRHVHSKQRRMGDAEDATMARLSHEAHIERCKQKAFRWFMSAAQQQHVKCAEHSASA